MREEFTTILTCKWEKQNTEKNKTLFRIHHPEQETKHPLLLWLAPQAQRHPIWPLQQLGQQHSLLHRPARLLVANNRCKRCPLSPNSPPVSSETIAHPRVSLPLSLPPPPRPCHWHQSAEARVAFNLTQSPPSNKPNLPRPQQWLPAVCRVSPATQGTLWSGPAHL